MVAPRNASQGAETTLQPLIHISQWAARRGQLTMSADYDRHTQFVNLMGHFSHGDMVVQARPAAVGRRIERG